MITRTETARTQNVANYVINKERGATHWYALGFEDEKTCAECIKKFGTISDPVYYEIEDTKFLPPIHPNCRHTAIFTIRNKTSDNNKVNEEVIEIDKTNEKVIENNKTNEKVIDNNKTNNKVPDTNKINKKVPDYNETIEKYEKLEIDGKRPINIIWGVYNEFYQTFDFSESESQYMDYTFKKDKNTGRTYLNGLDITDYLWESGKKASVPLKAIEKYNKDVFGITNSFWVFEVDLMYSKYLNKEIDADGTVYAVDKHGNKWIIDNDFRQQKKQDAAQDLIDFSDIRQGPAEFGGGGYGVINDLIFKKKFMGKDCEMLMYDITPILDEMRKEAYKESVFWKNPRLTELDDKLHRRLAIENDENLTSVVEAIVDIDIAQARAPPLQDDITVVRYGHFKEEWLDMDKTHTIDGYQSTSRSEYGALGFYGMHVDEWNIRILIRAGHKGMSLTSETFAGYEGEREWLTPRKQDFKTVDYDLETRTVTIEFTNNISGLDLPIQDWESNINDFD